MFASGSVTGTYGTNGDPGCHFAPFPHPFRTDPSDVLHVNMVPAALGPPMARPLRPSNAFVIDENWPVLHICLSIKLATEFLAAGSVMRPCPSTLTAHSVTISARMCSQSTLPAINTRIILFKAAHAPADETADCIADGRRRRWPTRRKRAIWWRTDAAAFADNNAEPNQRLCSRTVL